MATEVAPPIVINLGKQKKKRIKRLKRGRGRLAEEVRDVVAEVGDTMGAAAAGKELVPVVMIYRRKRKKSKGGFPLWW